MLSNLKNVFKIPDLRNKILFTVAMIVVYRLGIAIRVPGIDNLAVDQIKDYVGADSLGYLSLEGMVAATGQATESFCRACFDGDYPIPIPEHAGKFLLEHPAKS